MTVRLTERDAGPLPRGKEPEPARRAPVRAAGGSAIGRTLASSRAVAAPTPDRRLGDENDLPLDVHSVSPPLIVRQPTRPDRNIHADRSGDEPIRQDSDGPPSSLHPWLCSCGSSNLLVKWVEAVATTPVTSSSTIPFFPERKQKT